MAWNISTLCVLALTCGLHVNAVRVRRSNHVSNICSMWGNFHFKTFDGDVYQFQGTCEYNFVSDCHGPVQGFSVHVKRAETPGNPEITRVMVTIGGMSIELTKHLVMVNSDVVKLPHYVAGVMLEENPIYMKLYAKLGLSVTWNKDDAVTVEVDSKYSNHTCGLCGDFNGIPVYNEFLSDDRVTGFIEFGNKHRIHNPNDNCEDPYEEFESEANPIDKCQLFRDECSEQLFGEPWSFCRSVLSPEPYVQACMMDKCMSRPGDTEDTVSLCSTLSEYSRQCSHAGGKPPNWRKPTFCAVTCPFNMEYSESGSPCVDTCTHSDTSSLCEEHKMDGCFCPPGTVFDDISERGCIPQEQCQCKHDKVYNPGEVLLKNDQECLCEAGKWICQSLSIPGVCAMEEGSHFTTFDGKEFTFHGKCYYVLSRDCVDSKFTLLGQLIPCVANPSDTCLKSIALLLNNDKNNALIIKDDGTVRQNGDLTLPYTTAEFTVFRPSSFHIMLQTSFGLQVQVQLVPLMQLYITLDQSFHTKTCGLCGNFNMVLSDELMTPQGVVEGTATSFANSWKAQSNCPDQTERLDDPCSYSIDSESYAEHWCSKLKENEGVFAKCHSAVNPEKYFKRCKYSSCTCEKSEDCLCAVFSSYVRACAAKGVFLQGWRETVCDKYTKSCPDSQTFTYKLQQCQRTCDSLSLDRQGCSTDFVPVDGCACPEGLYEDENGVCVPMDKCPCYYNGKHIKPGKSINIKNEHCICTNGKLQCQSWGSHIEDCPAPKVFFNCSTAGLNEHGLECAQTCAQKDVDCYLTACESGCQCPTGLLDDGRGFCVEEHDCPCKHNNDFYAPRSQITEECNTCICKHGKWHCTHKKCPGACTIYGSGHYKTFDKQRFGFSGDCSYIALQDKCGNKTGTFHVITENVPCGTTGTTCSKAVRIVLGNTELVLSDGKITVIKAEISLPVHVRNVGLYLVIESDIGLTVLWDRKTTVQIILQPQHMGEVCGLCGNYNGNGKDDFTTQGLLHVSDVLEFVNSWKVQGNCLDAKPDFDPCFETPNRHTWAKLQCSIIKSDTFKDCHNKVEWTPYFENCVKDSCSCDTGGDCECFCTAVAAYAQACNEAGVCVAWRTPEICPVFCDYYNYEFNCTWHYSPCHTPCYKTCLNPNGTCTNPLPNVEGCYPNCPEDKPIFDEKKQICTDECEEETTTTTVPTTTSTSTGTQPPLTPTTPVPTTTISSTTTPCMDKCEWSDWINVYNPADGGGNDLETYENIKKNKTDICEYPEEIECRAVVSPDMSLKDFVELTGQVVQCDVSFGLVCEKKKQTIRPYKCFDYEIRVRCCDLLCPTSPTTPVSPTTTESTSTPSTPPPTTTTESTSTPSTPAPTTTTESTSTPPTPEPTTTTPEPTTTTESTSTPSTPAPTTTTESTSTPSTPAPTTTTESTSTPPTPATTTTTPEPTTTTESTSTTPTPAPTTTTPVPTTTESTSTPSTPPPTTTTESTSTPSTPAPTTTTESTSTPPTPGPTTTTPEPTTTTESTSTTGTTTTVLTTTEYSSTTTTQTPPTPTTPVPTTTTISSTITPCVDKCEWSDWINVYNPADGGGNDLETYENIKKNKTDICEYPEEIECRAVVSPDMSLKDFVELTGQVVQCDVSFGLVCEKKKQTIRPYKCFDYEIRVRCCDLLCPTSPTTPVSPTTTESTSTPSTPPPTTTTESTSTPSTPAPTTTTESTSTPPTPEPTTTTPEPTTTTESTSTPSTPAPTTTTESTSTPSTPAPTTTTESTSTPPTPEPTTTTPEPTTMTESTSTTPTPAPTTTTPVPTTTESTSTPSTPPPTTTTESTSTPSTPAPTTTTESTSTPPTPGPTTTTPEPTTTTESTSTTGTTTTVLTTTEYSSTTTTQTPPTPTTPVPTTTTISSTITPCVDKCEWSDWINVYNPADGGGNDLETYENIKKNKTDICEYPEEIECRAVVSPDMSLKDFVELTGQVVQCDVSFGLVCEKKKQTIRPYKCFDYEIRVRCCDLLCPTSPTTPVSPTTTESTSTPSTPPPTTTTESTSTPSTPAPTTTTESTSTPPTPEPTTTTPEPTTTTESTSTPSTPAPTTTTESTSTPSTPAPTTTTESTSTPPTPEPTTTTPEPTTTTESTSITPTPAPTTPVPTTTESTSTPSTPAPTTTTESTSTTPTPAPTTTTPVPTTTTESTSTPSTPAPTTTTESTSTPSTPAPTTTTESTSTTPTPAPTTTTPVPTTTESTSTPSTPAPTTTTESTSTTPTPAPTTTTPVPTTTTESTSTPSTPAPTTTTESTSTPSTPAPTTTTESTSTPPTPAPTTTTLEPTTTTEIISTTPTPAPTTTTPVPTTTESTSSPPTPAPTTTTESTSTPPEPTTTTPVPTTTTESTSTPPTPAPTTTTPVPTTTGSTSSPPTPAPTTTTESTSTPPTPAPTTTTPVPTTTTESTSTPPTPAPTTTTPEPTTTESTLTTPTSAPTTTTESTSTPPTPAPTTTTESTSTPSTPAPTTTTSEPTTTTESTFTTPTPAPTTTTSVPTTTENTSTPSTPAPTTTTESTSTPSTPAPTTTTSEPTTTTESTFTTPTPAPTTTTPVPTTTESTSTPSTPTPTTTTESTSTPSTPAPTTTTPVPTTTESTSAPPTPAPTTTTESTSTPPEPTTITTTESTSTPSTPAPTTTTPVTTTTTESTSTPSTPAPTTTTESTSTPPPPTTTTTPVPTTTTESTFTTPTPAPTTTTPVPTTTESTSTPSTPAPPTTTESTSTPSTPAPTTTTESTSTPPPPTTTTTPVPTTTTESTSTTPTPTTTTGSSPTPTPPPTTTTPPPTTTVLSTTTQGPTTAVPTTTTESTSTRPTPPPSTSTPPTPAPTTTTPVPTTTTESTSTLPPPPTTTPVQTTTTESTSTPSTPNTPPPTTTVSTTTTLTPSTTTTKQTSTTGTTTQTTATPVVTSESTTSTYPTVITGTTTTHTQQTQSQISIMSTPPEPTTTTPVTTTTTESTSTPSTPTPTTTTESTSTPPPPTTTTTPVPTTTTESTFTTPTPAPTTTTPVPTTTESTSTPPTPAPTTTTESTSTPPTPAPTTTTESTSTPPEPTTTTPVPTTTESTLTTPTPAPTTTTPITTTTESTSTPSTPAPTTTTASTSTPPTPTTGTTSPPPLKNCTEWGVTENETFVLCNCTKARCIENYTIEIIPYECPPLENITCSNGKPPVQVPDKYECCKENKCDCFCEGWGDPHYKTFDGLFYSYQGECTYVLMEEISPKHNLKIYIDNVNCDPRESVSCPRAVIVSYNNLVITLKNTNLIGAAKLEALMGHSSLNLPFHQSGVRVVSSQLNLILEIPELMVVVMFGVTGFSVNLPFQHFGNNTQGHCGTCNNNQADDCMLPGGEIVGDCAEMANHWQAKDLYDPECKPPPPPEPTKPPCPINPVCELLKSDLFKECHPHLPPDNYITGCQFDSCHMSNPAVVCTSLQTYAVACSQLGFCINWRDHTDRCPVECPADKVYQACGPVDPPSCKDNPEDHFMNTTTEGCFCPDGTQLFSKESGVCVDKCGCLDPSGQGRELGEQFQYGCQDCVCDKISATINCKPKQCSNNNQVTCSDPGFIVVNVTDPSDACCTILTCRCESSTCPSVNDKCPVGYTPVLKVPEGKCCPELTCEPKNVCVHKGLEYEPGTSVPVVDCQECHCTWDVDPKTELYKIQCGFVTCNEKCDPGYVYVESNTAECCGKCVQNKCVINNNGTVHTLESGSTWIPSHDACNKFICTIIDGQYVTTNYKVQCPPFNIDDCQPGTMQLSADRCCRVCEGKDTGCKVHTTLDYITYNNCKSKTTVAQTYCQGHCNSYSKYTELDSSSCSCCQASLTSNRTVNLDCINGDSVAHTYFHVEACNCNQANCLQVPDTGDTRRRRSIKLP